MKLKQISENLQGVKKYQVLSWEEIILMLDELGIKVIGNGSYGQVFYKDGWDYVIKVFEKDDAYMSFVDFAINNPNKHYPKFVKKMTSFKQFHLRPYNSHEHFYIVRIEKLNKISQAIEDFLFKHENLNIILDAYVIPRHHNLPITIYHSNDQAQTFNNLKELFAAYNLESFVQAIAQIDTLPRFPTEDEDQVFSLDLATNIMQRKNGTLVISDPTADFSGPEDTLHRFRRTLKSSQNKSIGELISGPKKDEVYKQLEMNFR